MSKLLVIKQSIFIGGCNFEILINGFPIERYYGLGNGALSASVPINTEILKSGLQSWKLEFFLYTSMEFHKK